MAVAVGSRRTSFSAARTTVPWRGSDPTGLNFATFGSCLAATELCLIASGRGCSGANELAAARTPSWNAPMALAISPEETCVRMGGSRRWVSETAARRRAGADGTKCGGGAGGLPR